MCVSGAVKERDQDACSSPDAAADEGRSQADEEKKRKSHLRKCFRGSFCLCILLCCLECMLFTPPFMSVQTISERQTTPQCCIARVESHNDALGAEISRGVPQIHRGALIDGLTGTKFSQPWYESRQAFIPPDTKSR